MPKHQSKHQFPALFGLGVLMLTGCVEAIHTGPTQHETKSIPLDKSEMVRAEIKIGAGNLKIRGGSSQLVDTDFTYNVPDWKPEVRYDGSGFRGRLTIEQPSHHHGSFGNSKYEWDVRFNNEVPLSLNLNFGAGNAELELGSLSLDQLDIHMGVGNLRLDLKGTPKKDYQVSIHGGIGNATIYLPDSAGVVAEARGGIGSVDAQGLRKHGSRYVNEAYENHANVTVRFDIHGGIGSVHLIGG